MAEEGFTKFLASKVRDADTFEDAEGTPKRLLGIDAPEAGTPKGDAATAFTKKLVDEGRVETKETGRKGFFGRDLVEAKLEGTETPLSSHLIRLGHGRPVSGSESDEENLLAESASTAARVLGVQDRGEQNPYDLDLSGNTANDFRSRRGTFGRAVGRGVDNVQQLGYSASNVAAMAVGDLFGTEVLDSWGEEGLRRNMIEAAMNPATVEKWDDVDGLGTGFTYVLEALGEQLPNIATLVGTGGVGAAAKFGVSKLTQAGIQKKLQQLALKQGNKLQVNKALKGSSGFTPGIAAGSFGFGTGEIGNELRDAGIDSPITALVGAIPFAALDTIGFQATIGRLFRGIDKDIATQSVKDIAKNVFKASGVGAGAESSTEMLQEVITLSARAFHDPTFEIFSNENLARIKEAGIKAGIVGGVFGGGSTVATSAVGKLVQPRGEQGPPTASTDVAPDAGQPPAVAAAGVTTFPQRSTDYGYIPDEATIPAQEVFENAPADAVVSIRGMLEQEIEPALATNESQINAFEALKSCLSS